MRALPSSLAARVGSAVLAVGLLGGCSLLNGNVKGSFSCRAPDGTCAPTSRIDDAAVALIAGDQAAPLAQPARAGHLASSGGQGNARAVNVPQRRTGEKVLRIMFPAYIDDRGRLHEASAVHAVVAEGAWVPDGKPVLPAQASSEPAARAPVALGSAAIVAPALVPVRAPPRIEADLSAASEEVSQARPPTTVEEVRAKVDAVLAKPRRAIEPVRPQAVPATIPASGEEPGNEAGAVRVTTPDLPGAPEED